MTEMTEQQAELNLGIVVERIDNLKESMLDKFDENAKEHAGILVQTTKTNGKVKEHDKWIFGMVCGGLVITTTVIPLIMYIYFDKVNQIQNKIDESVSSAVAEALNEYDIKVIK